MTGTRAGRSGRRELLGLGRTAGTAGLALAGLLWPSRSGPGGGPALPLPGAGVAEAGDEWCDVDPVLLISTPGGNLETVFFLTGVQGTLNIASALLGLLSAKHSVAPDGGGTRVSLSVYVPSALNLLGLGKPFPARCSVWTGPLGTGECYGSVYGETGKVMTVTFRLDTP